MTRVWVLLGVLVAGVVANAKEGSPTRHGPTKEPAYAAVPRYGLLTFGAQESTRIWIVLDGDVLYIDRNGNGDLTEKGEKLALPAFGPPNVAGPYSGQREVRLASIQDGPRKHTELHIVQRRVSADFGPNTPDERQLKDQIATSGQGDVLEVSLLVDVRIFTDLKLPLSGRVPQTAGVDAGGYLQLAATPRDAPVVRFGGTLHMGLLSKQALPRGDKPGDLITGVGTPGRGPGTFATVEFGGFITDGPQPVAEVLFPSAAANGVPVSATVPLPRRC